MDTIIKNTMILILLYNTLLWSNSSSIQEGKMKALFVEKFALFSEWPDSTSTTHFTLAFLGESEVTRQMEKLYKKKFMGYKVKLIFIKPNDTIPPCHLLYVATTDSITIKKVIGVYQRLPVLTVSDVDNAYAMGIIITMFIEKKKLRFEVNRIALEETPIGISYKLLQLSKKKK